MKPTILYIEKQISLQLQEHILNHLPRMTEWYEWEGCELVYLPLHQSASGNWNTTSEYLGSVFPLVADSRFSELLDTLHEPSNRLVSRLISSTDLLESKSEAFLFYTDRDLLKSDMPFVKLAEYNEGIEEPLVFFCRGFRKLWEIKNCFYVTEPQIIQLVVCLLICI